MRQLYYGDNLDILRRYVKDGSVDLVYLDPPFKSDQNYNVLFKDHSGKLSTAQIQAFEDTWKWDLAAAEAYEEVVTTGPDRVSLAMQSFKGLVGESDMLAYLAMMAPRLVELHRVLKKTGSLYLHCDPTASHYLKLLLDAVFGPVNFRNEIIWQRTNARSTGGRWPRLHDVLLMYSKSPRFHFERVEVKVGMAKMPHTLITGPDGKKYNTYELTGSGVTTDGESGKPWRGFDPSTMGRHWGYGVATLEEWDRQGLIHWPKNGGWPRRRDSEPFSPKDRVVTVGDVWTDIDRINQTAKERLGYPTQKPEALLERIITASCPPKGVVLDPFCGCGTTVAAAEKLNRKWVGIDITPLAISLIKSRLRDMYGDSIASKFKVIGEPTSMEGARQLATDNERNHFEYWALGLVGAHPREGKKRGADKGIDGRLFFIDDPKERAKQIIVSVKSGKVSVPMIRDLRGVIEREEAAIGVFISLQEPTAPMRKEALSAGFYNSPFGRYPRLQILTIEELLAGKRIDYPKESQRVDKTFRRAVVAERAAEYQAQKGLFDAGEQ